MTALLGVGVLVMIVADAIVGARLVGLWRHTGRLPELALGSAVLLVGALGYPLAIAARNDLGGSPELDIRLLATSIALQNLGCACMALATLGTFRAGVVWARGLFTALAALLAGSWLVQLLTHDFASPAGQSFAYWVGFAGRVLPFLWSAAESWRYHGLLRRRLRLGLTDGAVADRFRLWALSATGVVGAFGIFGVALLAGADVATSAWVLAPTSLLGCISGVSLWLAFLPPAWYLRRFAPAVPDLPPILPR